MDFVRETIRAADAGITALAVAFDESTENRGYIFDSRDRSRVHSSEYREYGLEEIEDMQSAKEDRLERMEYS